MAERRMLARSIIGSDAFSDMPVEAQMLYVRLNLAADDDGFVANPRTIMRGCGASNDSMLLLINKKFILAFEKGDSFIYLIKHWRIHNYIQSDRRRASTFRELLRGVWYDENKAYTMTPGEGRTPVLPDPPDTERKQSVSKTDTQDRTDEDRGRAEREKGIKAPVPGVWNGGSGGKDAGTGEAAFPTAFPQPYPQASEADFEALRQAALETLLKRGARV